MGVSDAKRWSIVFAMGVFGAGASLIGIFKTHGMGGEHFGSLFAGIVVTAIAASATKRPK